jgi:hypothetical protein
MGAWSAIVMILRPVDKPRLGTAFHWAALYDEGRRQAIGGVEFVGANSDGDHIGKAWDRESRLKVKLKYERH